MPGAPDVPDVVRAAQKNNRRAAPAAALDPALSVNVDPNPAQIDQDIAITGRLTAPDGTSMAGREIWLVNLVDDHLVDRTLTTADGSYEFVAFGEEAGSYELAVYFAGDATYNAQATEFTILVVDAAQLTATAEVSTVVPGQKVTLTGRLLDASGAPIGGARLAVTTDPSQPEAASATTRADGTWTTSFIVPPSVLQWGPDYEPNWPEYHVVVTWDQNRDNWPEAQAFVSLIVQTPASTQTPAPSPTAADDQPSVTPGSLADTGAPPAVGWWLGAGALALIAGLFLLLRRRR